MVVLFAGMFILAACDNPFGDGGGGGGTTPDTTVPEASVLETTLGMSFMVFGFVGPDASEPPEGVTVDHPEDGEDDPVVTMTFDGFQPSGDDFVINGELTFSFGEGNGGPTLNGTLNFTNHQEHETITFNETTWTFPDDNGDDEGPLGLEVTGTVTIDGVTYQMVDIIRPVQAAMVLGGLVGDVIVPIALDPEGVEDSSITVTSEGDTVTIEFDDTQPDPNDASVLVNGTITVVHDINEGDSSSLAINGGLSISGFIFDSVEFGALTAQWDVWETDRGDPGPPDSGSGTLTVDDTTYELTYLINVIEPLE